MVIRRGVLGLEESKCHSSLQNRQEGEPRELLATQPHLAPWKDDEVPHSVSRLYPHGCQEGDQN